MLSFKISSINNSPSRAHRQLALSIMGLSIYLDGFICWLIRLGRVELDRRLSRNTTPKKKKVRCSSNGNPTLIPLLMDQANMLPPAIGANALKE